MTDYIIRQAAIEALAGWKISPIVLEPVPSADVVEVVRCKDCIYRFGTLCKWREDETPDPDDYCSIGERL